MFTAAPVFGVSARSSVRVSSLGERITPRPSTGENSYVAGGGVRFDEPGSAGISDDADLYVTGRGFGVDVVALLGHAHMHVARAAVSSNCFRYGSEGECNVTRTRVGSKFSSGQISGCDVSGACAYLDPDAGGHGKLEICVAGAEARDLFDGSAVSGDR